MSLLIRLILQLNSHVLSILSVMAEQQQDHSACRNLGDLVIPTVTLENSTLTREKEKEKQNNNWRYFHW